MVYSSPAQFHHEPSGAFHICGVSADSLDWSHSRRLWPRTDLSLAIGSATGFSVALGNRLNCGFRCASRHQYLRRSGSLDHAEIRCLYCSLISEYYEISAIAAVPSDDAWPRNAFPVGSRRHDAAMDATRARLRQGADVLLSAAHPAHPSARDHRMLFALWTSPLDVRVTDSRAVPRYSTAGMGILSADCLSGLGFCGSRALSALPVVRSLEAAPQ